MPKNEFSAASLWSDHRFVSFDKEIIFYRRHDLGRPCKAVAILVHGMGEHGGRYRELAEFLGQKDIACFIPDLRGFGLSGGKRGCVRRLSDYLRDLEVVGRLARQDLSALPFFVLGHSFGGLLAVSWVASSPEIQWRGLVLSSPNFGIAIRVPKWRQWLALVASAVLPDHTENNGVDEDTLTHDKAISLRYKKDPLLHHRISARLYRELVHQLAGADRIASAILCSSLILQAGDDRVVSKEATVRFFGRLGSTDKQLKVFEGLYHEILNETDRLAIFSLISSWMEQRF